MTFKLPAMPQGVDRRFAKMNVRAPMAEANARIAMFSSIGIPVAEQAQDYVQRETEREVQAENLAMTEGVANFTALHSGVDQYDVEKTTDPYISSVMSEMDNIGSMVNGYRVYPEAAKRNQAALLEQSALRISDPNARRDFVAKYKGIGINQYAQDAVRATSKQQAFILKEGMARADNYAAQGLYEQAINSVAPLKMGKDAKKKIIHTYKTDQQKSYFNETLAFAMKAGTDPNVTDEDAIGMIDASLQSLTEQDPQTTGMLDSLTRRNYTGSLLSLRNRITKRQASEVNVANDEAMYSGRQIVALYEDNVNVSPSEHVDIVKQLSGVGTASSKKLINDLELGKQVKGLTSDFNFDKGTIQGMSVAKIQAILQRGSFEEGGEPISASDLTVLNKLKNNMENSLTAKFYDPVAWMQSTGTATIYPFDVQNPGASIMGRQSAATTMKENHNIYGAYFSKPEFNLMQDHLKSLQPKEKAKYLGSIMAGFDGDTEQSHAFLKRFRDNGGDGVWTVAGQRYMMGAVKASEAMIAGQVIAANQPEMVKQAKEALLPLIGKQMGSAFGYDKVEQGAILEATTNIYAYLSDDVGVMTEENVDKDRLQKAFNMATGAMVNYHGAKFVSPLKDNTNEGFVKYMNDMLPDHLEGLSVGYDKMRTLGNLRDGTYVWRATGMGKLAIFNSEEEKFLRTEPLNHPGLPNPPTEIFKFNFNTPLETVSSLKQKALDKAAAADAARELLRSQQPDDLATEAVKKLLKWWESQPSVTDTN